MSDDDDLDAITALLADECARTILVASQTEPVTADTLVERCDASRATVYRRLTELKQHDLIHENGRIEAGGHHQNVYSSGLDRVILSLSDDSFDLEITRREPMADQSTRLIEDM